MGYTIDQGDACPMTSLRQWRQSAPGLAVCIEGFDTVMRRNLPIAFAPCHDDLVTRCPDHGPGSPGRHRRLRRRPCPAGKIEYVDGPFRRPEIVTPVMGGAPSGKSIELAIMDGCGQVVARMRRIR